MNEQLCICILLNKIFRCAAPLWVWCVFFCKYFGALHLCGYDVFFSTNISVVCTFIDLVGFFLQIFRCFAPLWVWCFLLINIYLIARLLRLTIFQTSHSSQRQRREILVESYKELYFKVQRTEIFVACQSRKNFKVQRTEIFVALCKELFFKVHRTEIF